MPIIKQPEATNGEVVHSKDDHHGISKQHFSLSSEAVAGGEEDNKSEDGFSGFDETGVTRGEVMTERVEDLERLKRLQMANYQLTVLESPYSERQLRSGGQAVDLPWVMSNIMERKKKANKTYETEY